PAMPEKYLTIGKKKRNGTDEEDKQHYEATEERDRYRFGLHTAPDADGNRREACPAALGKVRCPHKPESMTAPLTRPEILEPPAGPLEPCCSQLTIGVPPDIGAKARQKYIFGSRAWE